MSVRRPAPLVAQHQVLSVGALADRLPGSTRLSQVLAAGAKHLAKHKTADTEAPGKRKIFGEVGERQTISRPIIAAYVNNLKRMVLDFMALQASGGSATQMQTLAQQIHGVVFTIAQKANSIEDMEVLRRMGAYFVLNWLYQHGTPQQSANAQLVLSESLHGEDDAEFNNILGNLHQGVITLGLADGPALALAHPDRGGVILNAPGPSDFNDAREAEQRQKVEDEREAKRKKQKTQEVSQELEEQVEAAQDAQGLQPGEIVPGQNEEQSKNQAAEAQQQAQGDNLGGGLGDDIGYGEASEPSDDEEDDFEGNPLAQQVNQFQKK